MATTAVKIKPTKSSFIPCAVVKFRRDLANVDKRTVKAKATTTIETRKSTTSGTIFLASRPNPSKTSITSLKLLNSIPTLETSRVQSDQDKSADQLNHP